MDEVPLDGCEARVVDLLYLGQSLRVGQHLPELRGRERLHLHDPLQPVPAECGISLDDIGGVDLGVLLEEVEHVLC